MDPTNNVESSMEKSVKVIQNDEQQIEQAHDYYRDNHYNHDRDDHYCDSCDDSDHSTNQKY